MDSKTSSEMLIDIASLSFTIEKTEEVGMAKIYTKYPYGLIPDAYSVSWSEWITNSEGNAIQAEAQAQTYKIKRIQKFESYELARQFFIKRIDEISRSYKEEIFKK